MFQIDAENTAATILRVGCEIDVGRSEAFCDAIRTAAALGPAPLVVMLDDCPYFDCSGVRVLVTMRRVLGSRLLTVVAAGGTTHRIFDILGLIGPLEIATTLEGAMGRTTALA